MEATQDHYYSPIMADSRNMMMMMMMMIKGKRTKRPRPSSPLALTMASTSSSTTTTSTGEDGDQTQDPNTTFNMMQTRGSIEFTKLLQENEEEEEEDMANCLILLAQGQSSPPSPPLLNKAVVVEVARTSEFYVYECKTCYRRFPSFQALGGHRASHKIKPSKPNMRKVQDHVDIHHSSITLSLEVGSNRMTHCNSSGSIKVAKVHGCSLCGAEFGSGQALGGHMRRHRSMPMATTSNCGDSGGCQESKKPKTRLLLDLNLPAPIEDDDQKETKLAFGSKDQMIAFSNSSLVHCHF